MIRWKCLLVRPLPRFELKGNPGSHFHSEETVLIDIGAKKLHINENAIAKVAVVDGRQKVEIILSGGQGSLPCLNDPAIVAGLLEQLAEHPRFAPIGNPDKPAYFINVDGVRAVLLEDNRRAVVWLPNGQAESFTGADYHALANRILKT